jgi:hypothetical protein
MSGDDPFGTVKYGIKPAEPRREPANKAAAAPAAPAKPGTPPPQPAPPVAKAPEPPKEEKPLEKKAAAVCRLFPIGEDAKKLLQEGQTVLQLLQALQKSELYMDAVRLLSHALPKRAAVWWACECIRSVLKEPPPEAAQALQAAREWCADPSEANRRAAEAAAEAAEIGTPAGCAAIAACWSGGSLSPPDAPVLPPGETLTAQAAANAVLMAAVVLEARKAPARFAEFLALGIMVAEGGNRWK